MTDNNLVWKKREPIFFDVTVKFYDERKERLYMSFGWDGNGHVRTLQEFLEMFDNGNLDYVKVHMSTYWRNKLHEENKRTESV